MITLIHGRAPKPPKKQLQDLWFEALRRSLTAQQDTFAQVPKEMIYYGDLSNEFLKESCEDIEARKQLLDSLEEANFEQFPGETAYGIDEPPDDILSYWDLETTFSRTLRTLVRRELESQLSKSSIVLAHSLGAVLVADALSSCTSSLSNLTLITLGSPLSLPHFLERSRLPQGLAAWHNVCARGDLICGPTPPGATHHAIINPLMKVGQPDPHHALGYLRHPVVGSLVSDWLSRHGHH